MPFTITMPKLSPTMEEGVIAKWHKKEGDFVEAGETLLEISTDKATVEHAALDEGYLRKILVKEGVTAFLNQPIAVFTVEKNENIEGYSPEGEAPPQKEAAEEVKKEAPALPKPKAPTPSFEQPAFIPEPPLESYQFEGAAKEKAPASPLARRLAKEKGLDISTVKGSGPGGRITSRDLEKAQPASLVTFGSYETPTMAPGTYEETSLTPIRKVIARRLQESKTFIPHFYVKQTVNADNLVAFRDQLKTLEIKVTFNDMVIRACALALRDHPALNTGFNSVNQSIIQFKTIDISVAVSFDEGLITPIIRHTDYKDLGQISVEMKSLAERAKKGKLAEHEYKGGSFTVSNLGMFGITEFTAVINPPQSSIIAVGGIEEAPIVKDSTLCVGKTLSLTLSVDHRVVDGADAARFLKTVQKLLENPVALAI